MPISKENVESTYQRNANKFVKLFSPFGVNEDYFKADTWKVVEELFKDTTFEEMYAGLLYMLSGRRDKISSYQ